MSTLYYSKAQRCQSLKIMAQYDRFGARFRSFFVHGTIGKRRKISFIHTAGLPEHEFLNLNLAARNQGVNAMSTTQSYCLEDFSIKRIQSQIVY